MTKKDTKFSSDKQPERRGDQVEAGKARAKGRFMTDALVLALNREVKGLDGKPTKRLNQIAEQLARKAGEEGDTQAIKEIFDRTEGKAAQAIIHQGDPEKPMTGSFVFVPVGPDGKSG